MSGIRPCRADEHAAILAIVNAAAEAYRGVIPADRWHEPYMPADELEGEIGAGIAFWGYEDDGVLIGVMGIQPVGEVDLIRHAYVVPGNQGRGVGRQLLQWLEKCAAVAGIVTIALEVRAANTGARRFYESMGYCTLVQLPGYYQGAEAALRMGRRLTSWDINGKKKL